MRCTECPDYKECVKKNDLRRKRHTCEKAKEPPIEEQNRAKEENG